MKPDKTSTPALPPSGSAPAPWEIVIGGKCISYHLTNVTTEDALFIGRVIRLYCDPIYASSAADVRAGRAVIRREPDGSLSLIPTFIQN